MPYSTICVRLSKIVMTGGLALWIFLAALGNVIDYKSNWLFVRHVLAMDTIFPDSKLASRAITDPTIQTVAFWAIIVVEFLTSLAFVAATVLMATRLTAVKSAFQRAKSVTVVGVTLAFALWFVGFMAIGGEWFVMWQSPTWNGQDAAFQFYMTVLAVAVYVFLDNDGEPGVEH